MSPDASDAPNRPVAECADDTAFLDHIQIASPCGASWEDMTGDDVVRHCGLCKLDVFDLSGLPRHEAAALVRGRAGRLCIRLYQRADGTLVSDDCRARLRKARQKGVLAFAAALVVVGVIQLAAQLSSLGLFFGAGSGQGGRWGGTPPLQGSPVALQGDVADPGLRMGKVAPLVPMPMPMPMLGQAPPAPPRVSMGEAPIQIRTPPAARRPEHVKMGKMQWTGRLDPTVPAR